MTNRDPQGRWVGVPLEIKFGWVLIGLIEESTEAQA